MSIDLGLDIAQSLTVRVTEMPVKTWDNEDGSEGAINTARSLTTRNLTLVGANMADAKSTRICSIDGCDRELNSKSARGLCSLHYPKWLAANKPRRCPVDGCESTCGVKSKICAKHSSRMYNHGTTDAPPARQEFCSVEGCDGPFIARGLCHKHWRRLTKHGDLSDPVRMTVADRIKRLIVEEDRGHTTPCWVYQGALQVNGYAQIRVGHGTTRKNARAHRASYEAFVGPIPEGLVIDHLCRVIQCVNPEHLEPVTQAENVRRAFSKERRDQ